MAATPGDNQETEGKMGGTTGASMLSSLAGMRVFLLFLAEFGHATIRMEMLPGRIGYDRRIHYQCDKLYRAGAAAFAFTAS